MPPANIVATNIAPYGTTGLVGILSNALQAASAFEQAISAVSSITGGARTGGTYPVTGGSGANPLTNGIYYVAPGYQTGMSGGQSPYLPAVTPFGGYNYGYPGAQAPYYGTGQQLYSPYTAFPQVGGNGFNSRLPAVNYLGAYNNYGSLLQNYMMNTPVVNGMPGGGYIGMPSVVNGLPGMGGSLYTGMPSVVTGMPGMGGSLYTGMPSIVTGMPGMGGSLYTGMPSIVTGMPGMGGSLYTGVAPVVNGLPGMGGFPGTGGIYYPGGQSLFTGMGMGMGAPRLAGVGPSGAARSSGAGNNNNNGRLAPFSNGGDGGMITSIGFGNPMIDAIMGTDYNGDIGGGNARRSTNNAVLQGGLLGASRFTNAQRTDFNALSNLINSGVDPLSESVFRTFRQEGGTNVYRAFVDGNPAAIEASRRADGTINGAELANQGNNTRGQAHWTKEVGRMEAGVNGTEVVIHNAVKGETVALPGGGYRTFIVNDNGGDHNGKIAGYVDDRYATSAQNAKDRINLNNQALSATDVGTDGGVVQTNTGVSAANYGPNSARGSGSAASGNSMAGMNH